MAVDVQVHQPGEKRAGPSGKRVHIGLDYGTCSTKVMIRPRGDPLAKVHRLEGRPSPGFPPFATPSAIRVHQDRISFGSQAIAGAGGTFIQSLKAHLLPHDPELGQTPLVLPPGTDLELLIACYLSWALWEVRQRIGETAPEQVSLNVAAPMSHIVDQRLKGRYLHIVQAAWESVFGHEPLEVHQGSDLRGLREYFTMWLEREVPALSHRRYEVLPETIAPIVSLAEDPKMEPGMYLMVDMGAGTSEFSVNQVTEGGADRKVNCYFDRSIRIGGDDLQALDRQAGHERFRPALLRRFKRSFNETWYSGSWKDRTHAARRKWRKLEVVLTGGGARHSSILSLLKEARPASHFDVASESYRISWHRPTDLDTTPVLDRIPADDLPLLSVAHGLSIERPKWPQFHKPHDIEKQAAPFKISPPVAYWHLDE